MIDVTKLGNTELVKCFLSLHYNKYGFYNFELENDPRIVEYEKIINALTRYLDEKEIRNFDETLFREATKNRGLKSWRNIKGLIYTDEFVSWQRRMLNSPTYLREVNATNFIGGYDISFVDDEWIGFDYPVRNACKILNEKGYKTYWSSANKEDFLSRRGQVIQNRTVAYILIDADSLNEELKEHLVLNGSCDFGEIAIGKQDNGRYYGIWTNILSLDELCEDIARELTEKALDLPELNKEEKKQPTR